jgi:hypothetical protein
MKKYIALFVLLGGVSFLAGCASTLVPESQKEVVPLSQNAELSQVIEYTNDQYGFSFKFPQTWKGYTVTHRTLDWGTFGKSDSLDFGFGTENTIFNIAIHTKEQWKKIAAEQEADGRYPQRPLAESKDFVFSFSTSGDVANDEMMAHFAEINSIIQTFSVPEFDPKV